MKWSEVSRVDEDTEVFRSLYDSLRRFAAVVAPREVDPDDLLQEAVARTLRHHRLSDLEHPDAYLRKTMLNLASNERRRFSFRRSALTRLQAGDPGTSVDVYPSDVEDLITLPARERAGLFLSEVEGYRFREIGEMLGCSEAAARKRALRGRRLVEDDLYWEPTLELWSCAGEYALTAALENLRSFVQAGGNVALGTDYFGLDCAWDLGMPMTEIDLMLEADMTPMQIIVAATKNGAHACGLDYEIGTLEVGKNADILVVDGDPLEDMQTLPNVQMVIHNGVVIRQE